MTIRTKIQSTSTLALSAITLVGVIAACSSRGEGPADSSGPYSLNQYEFNCITRQLREISFASYSATGNLLASRGDGKWESSIPDTLGETLLNDMCKSQK